MVFTNCGPVPGASKVTDAIFYTVHSFDVSSQVGCRMPLPQEG